METNGIEAAINGRAMVGRLEFQRMFDYGTTKFYSLRKDPAVPLETIKVGKKTMITADTIRTFYAFVTGGGLSVPHRQIKPGSLLGANRA